MSCPDCFSGGVSASEPSGTETTIHGIPTYVAQPEDGVTPRGIIVFITDAFGWKFVNNRVLSDQYAKKGGFVVYCPDFMDGKAMDPQAMELLDKIMAPAPSIMGALQKPLHVVQVMTMAIPWKMKTGIPTTHPKVQAFVQALRTSEPPFKTDNLKIGVAGFCWGGKHAFLLARDEESTRVQRHESQVNSSKPERLIDCAFAAHPSLLEVPKDIDLVTIPISVVVGDKDQVLSGPLAQQTKQILEGKNVGHEVSLLPDAMHGFAVRMHPDDKLEMKCAAKAEEQALGWFKKHLA